MAISSGGRRSAAGLSRPSSRNSGCGGASCCIFAQAQRAALITHLGAARRARRAGRMRAGGRSGAADSAAPAPAAALRLPAGSAGNPRGLQAAHAPLRRQREEHNPHIRGPPAQRRARLGAREGCGGGRRLAAVPRSVPGPAGGALGAAGRAPCRKRVVSEVRPKSEAAGGARERRTGGAPVTAGGGGGG